jgi:hypothetical protein
MKFDVFTQDQSAAMGSILTLLARFNLAPLGLIPTSPHWTIRKPGPHRDSTVGYDTRYKKFGVYPSRVTV